MADLDFLHTSMVSLNVIAYTADDVKTIFQKMWFLIFQRVKSTSCCTIHNAYVFHIVKEAEKNLKDKNKFIPPQQSAPPSQCTLPLLPRIPGRSNP